jgi:plastocyanin
MTDSSEAEGPRLVWTFPLVTRLQSKANILDLGSNIASMRDGTGPIRGAAKNVSSTQSSSDQDNNVVSRVEDKLDDVKESSESTFSQSGLLESSDRLEVSIRDEVFIPTRANIDEGNTVVWQNKDDESHSISSIDGEQFESGTIQPGEEFSYTFTEQGTTIYIDETAGKDNMSGAVTVGDVDAPSTLPSESDTEPELFDDDTQYESSSSQTRTMAAAAEDKEDMDLGFND